MQTLTAHELDILGRLGRGNSMASIAQELRLSEKTIQNISRTITLKLDARNRTHAVGIAIERGLIKVGA